jgi:hypothetical protein
MHAATSGAGISDEELAGDAGISDEELAALALAADPDVVLERGARRLVDTTTVAGDPLLPDWYMPALPGGRLLTRPWQRRVALFLVSAFLLIEGYGLCTTYGPIGPS